MNRNTQARAALLGIGLTLAAACAQAAPDEAATDQVRARLIASAGAVHAGDRLVLGVHQQIAPEWHTYWLNPGDTGLATRIGWTLPAGAAAGEIQWPAPQRFQLGPITNFGYAGEVTLLTEINVPQGLRAGDDFPVQAQVNWLVCRESCIPQKVELRLTLPVLAPGQPASAGSPLIEAARSRLPLANPWPFKLAYATGQATLRLENPGLSPAALDRLAFFPSQPRQLSNALPQTVKVVGKDVLLEMPYGDEPPTEQAALTGVLLVPDPAASTGVPRAYAINSAPSPLARPPAPGADLPASAPSSSSSIASLAWVLLLALLGGMVLNLMPCVFPVLSIKALSLLQHAERPARETRRHGLAYTLGVLASFALLGALLIVLKQGGAQIGWGFQYQSPGFVLMAAYLMFAVGLSLSGVFSVGSSVAGWGASLASRVGYSGSFFTGVLAAVVASPCTAPFMGAAIGYALTQPAAILLVVFLTLGLGLALPYLLLSHWPALQHRLPRPGRWMERVKQGLAFPMYGAAVWLAWVLAQQAGPPAVAAALGGMLAIGWAAWIFEATRGHARASIQHGGTGLALLVVAAALLGGQSSLQAQSAPPAQRLASQAAHGAQPYSAQRLQSLRSLGQPVFLNLTAAWCITCLVNERVALSDPSVQQAFERSGIHYLKGDWTNQDAQITSKLAEFGRSGVPLYVYYPANAGAEPVVLPQILTPQLVLDAVQSPVAVSVADTH